VLLFSPTSEKTVEQSLHASPLANLTMDHCSSSAPETGASKDGLISNASRAQSPAPQTSLTK